MYIYLYIYKDYLLFTTDSLFPKESVCSCNVGVGVGGGGVSGGGGGGNDICERNCNGSDVAD